METQAIIFEKKYLQARVPLPSSKSLSNRWLVLAFLYGKKIHLENISDSEDTLLMQDLLEKIEENEGEEKEITLDCRNAGSVMRFLTAQVAFKSGIWILTGNERMQHRPIGSLVEALRGIGIRIDYLGEEACPPMKIFGNEDILKTEISKISVDASLSSQFVSALMLTSPLFPRGLHIEILGEDKVSLPYIQMTAQIMRNGGLEVIFIDGSNIFIDGLLQLPSKIFVEADWTSASYLYTLLALSEGGRIVLPNLCDDSLQGDRILSDWFEDFGVETEFKREEIIISKDPAWKPVQTSIREYDFTHHPDLAQSIAVCCAALKLEVKLSGIYGLKFKETDRIMALYNELVHIGVKVDLNEKESELHLYPSVLEVKNVKIRTYGDHRMAMAFSVLAIQYPGIIIEDMEVVKKSFPNYWNTLKLLGATV